LPPDFYEKYSLDDFRYSQFYRYRNSDFFFSSFIVITESKNEVEIIKRIGDSAGIDYEMNGLSYLNLEGVDKAKYAIHLLSELEIPYLLIVDKDFFTPYLNDTFEDSLGVNGLPLYKKRYKNEELIKAIITNEQDRDLIIKEINSNHTKILDTLEPYNIISMRYSLDLDLVAVSKGEQKYYEVMKLPVSSRTVKELSGMKKGIKKIERVITVFESLSTNNWPYSYSRIKKVMNKITKSLAN
jgi:putative ATP-dependent endonuclease of OLD family